MSCFFLTHICILTHIRSPVAIAVTKFKDISDKEEKETGETWKRMLMIKEAQEKLKKNKRG